MVACLGSDLTGHNGGAGCQAIHEDLTCGIGGKFAVIVADEIAAAVSQQEFHSGERLTLAVITDFFDKQGAQGCVAETERHHILILAGDPHRLRLSVDDVIAVALDFLTDISASFEAGDGKGPIGSGDIGT